jgi:hypothetical protein
MKKLVRICVFGLNEATPMSQLKENLKESQK